MIRLRSGLQRLRISASRCFSSSSVPKPQESIRNIGILAHIDAGKKFSWSRNIHRHNHYFRQDNHDRTNAVLLRQDEPPRRSASRHNSHRFFGSGAGKGNNHLQLGSHLQVEGSSDKSSGHPRPHRFHNGGGTVSGCCWWVCCDPRFRYI